MDKGDVIEEVKPQKDYFVFSIVSFFFCPVFGILAIWKSSKTREKLRKGDDWYAELAAMDALKWALTAVAVGGAVYFMAILLVIYWLVRYYFGNDESPFIDL
ncbi:uncharacterized protein LOC110981203 [Acanthaster planci]|uniref:Uncharacterized protein LOC110981203 n=1 Tax=Acanthaster planci TaxID=133434 RepID=A0A8B7YSA0_ACAPL|nr:uncharacterized protein LOC110981203 [Acanthaster planci]